MRILSNADIADLLPMETAIKVVSDAMRHVSEGGAEMPLRHVVPVGDNNKMGVMSGAIGAPACFGVKLVSLFPGNPARGLSGHRGAVVLFEPETGGAVAMMDGGLLTAIRTAAASAVATRALARPEAQRLVLIGTGEQAQHHLTAICAVGNITSLHIVGRSMAKAAAFAQQAQAAHPGLRVSHGDSVKAGIEGGDILCTVTNSAAPVLSGEWLEPGMHMNIVGASIPSKREVDDAFVERADIWVDYRASALAQAGELIAAIEAGRMQVDGLRGEIGAVLAGDAEGRAGPDQITAYRSLGVIAQDLACAAHVLAAAEKAGRGTVVAF